MTYRILVTGSREWDDENIIHEALLEWGSPPDITLVSGGARGADRIAEKLALKMGWKVEVHPAKWEDFGNQAGYIRNAEMVKLGADLCLAFRKNLSKGTGSTADMAEAAGIHTIVYERHNPMIENTDMHRVAVTAIIFNPLTGKMLITRRALTKSQWPGMWTVPGGGIETDDYTGEEPSFDDHTKQWYGVCERAVRREVREETGLEITEPWLVTDLAFVNTDETPVLVLSFATDLRGPDRVRYDVDTIGHAWVDLEEAKEYELIPGIYEELVMAKERWAVR